MNTQGSQHLKLKRTTDGAFALEPVRRIQTLDARIAEHRNARTRFTDARLTAEPLPQNADMFGRNWTGHFDAMPATTAVKAVNDAIDKLERYRANRASRDADFANTLHGEMRPGDFGSMGTGRPEKEFTHDELNLGTEATPQSMNDAAKRFWANDRQPTPIRAAVDSPLGRMIEDINAKNREFWDRTSYRGKQYGKG